MNLLTANKNFRLVFSASAVSNLGDGVSMLAFPWLATLITRDPLLIALVAFASRLPWLLFTIPAGVITDRMDRRALMVRADMFRFVLTLGIVGVIFRLPGETASYGSELAFIAALSGIAFLLGTAEVLRDNAAQTILPSIVAKEHLEKANGQIWSVEQVMGSFVGPPLAGLLIAFAVPAPFMLDAATFAIAAWLIWCVAAPMRVAPQKRSMKIEAMEGLRWMFAHPIILRLAVMLGLMNALTIMALTILILFSQEILHLSAVEHGILLTAEAAGGIAGGLFGPRLAQYLGNRRSLYLALGMMTLPWAVIALTSNTLVVAASLFFGLFAGLLWNVITVSYRQRHIPDALLGRVNSVYRFFGWGMMPIGALFAGWLVGFASNDLGREAALRLPYWVAFSGFCGIWLYALFRLRDPL